MEAIEKRFGGNNETKKVQKTLLKQQYENFTGLSFESLDQFHDRLQKLISQLEILGESISHEDINLKFLQSLPTEWRTHTLIWRNKTDLEDQSLDNLFNSLKIYEAEVKSSSSTSPTTQNVAFVSSQNIDNTNESVSYVTSVSAASTKVPISALANVDNLSDVVIYSFFASQSNSPQLDNDDLKQIDVDDLEEMDLNWQMAMLTMKARRFLQRTGRNLGANGTNSIGHNTQNIAFVSSNNTDNTNESVSVVPSVSAASTKAPVSTLLNVDNLSDVVIYSFFARRNLGANGTNSIGFAMSKCNGVGSYDWSFQADEEPTNYALMAFTSSSSSSFDNEVFTSTVFDCDELISSESDVSMPISPMHDRYQSGEGYHAVPPPYTGNFIPPNPDLVFHDALTACDFVPNVLQVECSTTKPHKDMSQSNRPSVPIIKDWVSDSEDDSEGEPLSIQNAPRPYDKPVEHPTPAEKLRKDIPNTRVLTRSRHVPLTVARPVTTAVPHTNVTRLRPAKTVVTKPHSLIRRTINHKSIHTTSNFHHKDTTVKAKQVNPQQALKDKGVIDSGCSRHMTRNISYLYDFKAINRGYVTFGRNPKGGKITSKGKIKTRKLDFDDVYFVKELKFNLFSVLQMCDKKNSVLFTNTKCIVLSSGFKLPDDNHVLLRVPRENNMYNIDLKNIVPSGDLTCRFVKATLDEPNL
nr:ribonuclease H-like domain-containing protein [Tanacetum cinerariifolium]